MSRNPTTRRAKQSPPPNPHAERITVDELHAAVNTHYGTKTLLVDKTLAEAILELNTGNRSLNARKVERLVGEMQSGEFENTGEPVIISAEGVLNDGQHRLHALAKANVEIDLDVRFGIARRVFTKTDTGSSRTAGDVLSVRGVAGGQAVAPAVRLLVLYTRGLPDAIREFVSNSEVDAAFQRWKDIETVGRQIAGLRFPRGVKSTPLLATAHLASRSAAAARLPAWLETLATGLASGRTDPAYLLREALMRGVDNAVGTRESLLERFALMILSWNAYGAGEKMSVKDLRWTATGKGASPFPQVEGVRL
jgi:hypothetical protein